MDAADSFEKFQIRDSHALLPENKSKTSLINYHSKYDLQKIVSFWTPISLSLAKEFSFFPSTWPKMAGFHFIEGD